MTVLSTPIEREGEMILPVLPKNKCINHPIRQSVRKHLCSECLISWEKTVLDFEAIQPGEVLSPE